MDAPVIDNDVAYVAEGLLEIKALVEKLQEKMSRE